MTIEHDSAGELVGEILGEDAGAIALAIADCIEAAHAANPDGWELTLKPSGEYLRLNAGQILVAQVFRDSEELQFAVRLKDRAKLPAELEIIEPFKSTPSIGLLSVAGRDLQRYWPSIGAACLAAMSEAALATKKVKWHWAHSQGAVETLGSIAGRVLPKPKYFDAFKSPEPKESLEALFKEFLVTFGSGPKGALHADILAKSRQEAAKNFQRVRDLEAAGSDITNAVLDGFLPHAKTKQIVARGAWVSIAPAVSSDIRSWFEGAGLKTPGDWPEVAQALWRLISQSVAEPDEIDSAVNEFAANDLSKGFQAGMISPILNALKRDSFVIFNSKSRKALNSFAGTNFSHQLADFPEANRAMLEWSSARKDLFYIPELPDLRPHETFDMFSHWLVAERGTPGARKIWKIAPGEEGKDWGQWLEGGYAAIGWSELGDLLPLARHELDERGKAKSFSKDAIAQIWRFRSIEPGDTIVANRGTREILGIGEVLSGYYFEQGQEHAHRVRVNWSDTTLRPVDRQGWKRTLIPLSEKDFDDLKSGKVAEVAGAAFSARTFELLQELRNAPTKATYNENKEAIQEFVETPLHQLFDDVISGLPAPLLEVLETEKNLYSRILKNDWGKGGAWDFVWAAVFPKGTKRTEAAQLFVFVTADFVEAGFYVGEYGTEPRRRFEKNLERHGAALAAKAAVAWDKLGLRFGERDGGGLGPAQGAASKWIRELSAPGASAGIAIRAARVWTPSEAVTVPREELEAEIREIFESLFPLVLLVTEAEPLPPIFKYLGIEEIEVEVNPEYSLQQIEVETGVNLSQLNGWVGAIERKGQAIFYGPPGTGKTFLAEKIGRHMIGGGDGFVEVLQFHPSYAYEEFIQGLRPKEASGGGLRFEVVPGRFLDFCRKAQRHRGTCVLILDEINRANLSRVFGELMFLLEYRDREIPLAGGETLKVPKNVRILGTMNTADRSIALVDHALRRRFAFFQLYPDFGVLERHLKATGFPPDGLIKVLRRLNTKIADPHYEVGISFFFVENLAEHLEGIWKMEIEPYLEELFFDKRQQMEELRWAKIASEVLGT